MPLVTNLNYQLLGLVSTILLFFEEISTILLEHAICHNFRAYKTPLAKLNMLNTYY
jgi:hypothetical protein